MIKGTDNIAEYLGSRECAIDFQYNIATVAGVDQRLPIVIVEGYGVNVIVRGSYMLAYDADKFINKLQKVSAPDYHSGDTLYRIAVADIGALMSESEVELSQELEYAGRHGL